MIYSPPQWPLTIFETENSRDNSTFCQPDVNCVEMDSAQHALIQRWRKQWNQLWDARLSTASQSAPLPEFLRGIGPGAQECLLVLSGERDAARVIVPAGMVIATLRRANALGLTALPSPFFMRTIPLDSKLTYSDRVDLVPNGVWDSKAKVFVYLARSAEMASRVWVNELLQDDAELGRLFGYPQCCIAAFKRKSEFQSVCLENSVGYALRLTNQYSRLFGFEIISHKPCSPDCRETLSLASRYLRTLRSISPTASSYLMDVLSSPVLVIDSMNFIILIGAKSMNKHKFEALTSEFLSFGSAANDFVKKMENNGPLVTFQATDEGILFETTSIRQLMFESRLVLHA